MLSQNAVHTANVMSFNTPNGKRIEMREVDGVIQRFELDHIDDAAEDEALAMRRKSQLTAARGASRTLSTDSMQEHEVRNMHKLLANRI